MTSNIRVAAAALARPPLGRTEATERAGDLLGWMVSTVRGKAVLWEKSAPFKSHSYGLNGIGMRKGARHKV